MKDSLDYIQTSLVKPLDSQEIKDLKRNLTKNDKTETKRINTMINEDIVNFTNANNINPSGFKKKIRTKTPDYSKRKFNNFSMFSRSYKNFFNSNNKYKDINDISSEDSLTPIELKNKFQALLGKLNDNSTKEIAFEQIKQLITFNPTQESLRVYISSLSSFAQNASVNAKEIQALLYGFLSQTYKENLIDPLDKPPNIIKTINRLLTHIRNLYLKENSYIVHKACAHSIIDIYDLCTPKDNMKSINILFIEPLIALICSGNGKSFQEGASICIADFIYHLGKDNSKEINSKILSTLDSKMVSLITKSTLDIPYLFEAFFNLLQFLPFESFTNNLKEIYDRIISILSKNNANKYNYLTKVKCLNILSIIAQKCTSIADISIGYYQNDIIKVIQFNTKDKVLKVQQAANEALKNWKELSIIHEDLNNKKMIINNPDLSPDKNNFLSNNGPVGNMVKKMDKLTFLRNLVKMAKIENKKVDYDTELPDKLKDDIYKKGIGNIMRLSNFLKKKNNNKNNTQGNSQNNMNNSNSSFKMTNKDNKIKMEIQDYLKYSDLVKKYNNGNNNIFHTNPNIIKNELLEVSEVNEYKEISNRNNSEIKERIEIPSEEQGNLQFKEEEVGQQIQLENFQVQQLENNISNENENFNEDNLIQNQPLEFNPNINPMNLRKNQLPKLNIYQREKPPQKEKISITSNNTALQRQKECLSLDLNPIKNTLTELIQNNLLSLYNSFEKSISSKLIDMDNRINDLYLKLNDYQSHPNYNKLNKSLTLIGENDYYINNNKFDKLPDLQEKQNSQLNRNMIYKDVMNNLERELSKSTKKEDPNTDSQITKTWKDAIHKIENNHINEAYEIILNSGDDIYLLRLICLTGPIFNQISPEIAKRILIRVNMISRYHQIQSLLISLIRHSLNYNIFTTLSKEEQNDILDSLYEFSGLNNTLGAEASELYAQITK